MSDRVAQRRVSFVVPGVNPPARRVPALSERGAVTDLGRYAEALVVHRHPKRVRLSKTSGLLLASAP